MKIHKHLVIQVFQALRDIFVENYHADKVVERNLMLNKRWGARDRRFFAETVYDIVRWWRKLWGILNQEPEFDDATLWKLWGIYYFLSNKEIPDLKEVEFLKKIDLPKLISRIEKQRAVFHSIPDWLYEVGFGELHEVWEECLSSLNRPAPAVLRVNTLKTSAKDLHGMLLSEDIETVILGEKYPEALQLKERKNVFQTNAYKSGFFEMQDPSSQLVARFLEPVAGMRVVDACAGSGGKTLHIAALMKNLGKIIALDPLVPKLEQLKKRCRRAGVFIVESRIIESTKTIKRIHNSADRLLLDVPCSGVGVLKRNPDTKWKLTPERLKELNQTQSDILEQYTKIVKVGGICVYSTCSILPSENTEQIKSFIDRHKSEWEFVSEQTIYPHESAYDGFYMAKIKRL